MQLLSLLYSLLKENGIAYFISENKNDLKHRMKWAKGVKRGYKKVTKMWGNFNKFPGLPEIVNPGIKSNC